MEVQVKVKGPPKTGRITLCVEESLEETWKYCVDNAEGVTDEFREFLSRRLPEIRAAIDQKMSAA